MVGGMLKPPTDTPGISTLVLATVNLGAVTVPPWLSLRAMSAVSSASVQAEPSATEIVARLLVAPPARTCTEIKHPRATLDGRLKTIWSSPGKPCDRPAYSGVTSC